MNIARITTTILFIGLLAGTLLSCAQHRRESDHASDSRNETDGVAIPLFTNVGSMAKDPIRRVLSGYFKLNQALADDSLSGAKTAATDLLAITRKMNLPVLTEAQNDFYFIQSAKLKTALLIVSQSADIDQARSGFAVVSEAMYALVKAFRVNSVPLYYQYCPMARNNQGANWLSVTKELVNPYMGQLMLDCGRTQEKLE